MFLFISGKPTRKRKRFGRFLHWLWKAMKGSFCCRCHSCAVDVVEPFVPPADLEPEPEPDPTSPRDPDPTSPPDPDPTSPPDTDLSGVEPNNGKWPVLISLNYFKRYCLLVLREYSYYFHHIIIVFSTQPGLIFFSNKTISHTVYFCLFFRVL